MYLLADVNSMYAACEAVFRPEWRGKGIAVFSNNDGVCVAANSIAQSCGVVKFKSYFELESLCHRHGVKTLSSNYALYGSLSNRLMNVLSRFAPRSMQYSIDEMYLQLDGMKNIGDLYRYGELIRKTAWREVRLPISIGIGQTLTLAKAANHAAKRIPGYNSGVCVIDSEQKRQDILSKMDITKCWGIGSRLGKKLNVMKIYNTLQLANMPAKLARQQFNVEVERIVLELNSARAKNWDDAIADKQQIFSTRSLGQRITEKNTLHEAIVSHVCNAAAKCRAQGSLCGAMMIFASNSAYDEKPSGFKRIITFSPPTSDSMFMANQAAKVLETAFNPDTRYYRVGVGLLDLSPAKNAQYDLFSPSTDNVPLMEAMDTLNSRYGRNTVFVAGQGIEQRWQMRRDMLSPQYTTNWRHLPRLKC